MTSLKSPTILRRLFTFPSSYRHSCLLFFSRTIACRSSGKATERSETSFMEVVKQALKHASGAKDHVALRSVQKSYSYSQLVSSALDVSSILRTNEPLDLEFKWPPQAFGRFLSKGRWGWTRSAPNFFYLKVKYGDRIGIAAKPSPEFVAAIMATWLNGAIAVPLALSYPEAELLHVMNDSDISMVLSSEEHRGIMESISNQCSALFSLLPIVTSISNSNNGEATPNSKLVEEVSKFKPQEEDVPALILYTSGTTGKPKGVVHTHKSIISQVQILTEAWEYTSKDQFLNCLPLHHVHGLFNALLAPLYAGAVVEFIPKFSVRGIWQRWRESYPKNGPALNDAITVFTGVPTMYTRLLQGYETMDSDQKLASAFAASQLRLMMCGSSALPYPIMKQWEETTSHRLLERYGMTEFVMAIANPLHGNRKGGTVGKPLPRVEVKIMMEDGTETKTGVGELCVKSPSLFKEYWKRATVTNDSFTDDGYFKTGDTVTVDEDGYFIILGRTNADIMKVGGYKLSALEIEAVLLEHEAVSECCVLGLTDKDYGEIVCAIIVPHEETKKNADLALKPALTLEELRNWAKDRLAPYKIPTKLLLWDTLPRNAMGKVNKKEMKKLVEDKA